MYAYMPIWRFPNSIIISIPQKKEGYTTTVHSINTKKEVKFEVDSRISRCGTQLYHYL